nr:hypothetical protein [uncultured Oscillibacter sp.]
MYDFQYNTKPHHLQRTLKRLRGLGDFTCFKKPLTGKVYYKPQKIPCGTGLRKEKLRHMHHQQRKATTQFETYCNTNPLQTWNFGQFQGALIWHKNCSYNSNVQAEQAPTPGAYQKRLCRKEKGVSIRFTMALL